MNGSSHAMDRRWVVLSPHPDDAVLSIGGTLASRQDTRLWICTLTTRTSSSVHPWLDDSVELVSALRCAEDAICARFLGAEWVGLGLDDAVLQPDVPVSSRISHFEAAIERIIAELDPHVVLCPLGVGTHPDHVATHEAVLRQLPRWRRERPALRVWFYEDLPYAALDYLDVMMRVRRLEASAGSLRVHWTDLSEQIDTKLAAIAIYRTQAWQSFSDAAVHYARVCGRDMRRPYPLCERVWILED